MKKNTELIGGIFWLVTGVLLSFWSTQYQIGSVAKPGPGSLPLLLGILLIVFSLILLLGQAKKSVLSEKGVPPSSLSGGWRRVAYVILILLGATFLFEVIGYILTFFLLIVSLMWGVGLQDWRKILVIALFTTLAVYFVFVLLLKQQLPRGLLEI